MFTDNTTPTSTVADTSRTDRGFSLVELLIIIVILGILATVVVFSVRGFTDKGEDAACGTDARTLSTAAEVFFAQNSVDALPASGSTDGDEFERTLVDAQLIKDISAKYDLQSDGTVLSEGAPC
ncbi:MAG: prepilin-type N-terminal cleavage/methylation domain-containing protein [Actinomycetota bacterium]